MQVLLLGAVLTDPDNNQIEADSLRDRAVVSESCVVCSMSWIGTYDYLDNLSGEDRPSAKLPVNLQN